MSGTHPLNRYLCEASSMSQDKPEDNLSKVRRHFRKETGKLDNWIYHRRLDEYFKQEEKPNAKKKGQ